MLIPWSNCTPTGYIYADWRKKFRLGRSSSLVFIGPRVLTRRRFGCSEVISGEQLGRPKDWHRGHLNLESIKWTVVGGVSWLLRMAAVKCMALKH